MSDPEFAQLRADLAEATRRMFWTLDSALENLLAIGAIDEGQAAEARSRMQGKYHSPFGPPSDEPPGRPLQMAGSIMMQ